MKRLPRDVSVHLFRRNTGGPSFLMLRRCAARGGFWQGITGAPLPGETDLEAAIREVREETALDLSGTIFPLGVSYSYTLRPELEDRWKELYGPGITRVSVVSFAAELQDGQVVLDPSEHDYFAWCSYEEADTLLDWPIEQDALAGRREALSVLMRQLQGEWPVM